MTISAGRRIPLIAMNVGSLFCTNNYDVYIVNLLHDAYIFVIQILNLFHLFHFCRMQIDASDSCAGESCTSWNYRNY